jgi:hypothetical protein
MVMIRLLQILIPSFKGFLPMNLRTFISATLLLSSMAAQADTIYDFSYTFNSQIIFPGADNTDVISGRFTGTANGNIITNLSNITLSFDGVAIPTDSTGSMYAGSLQNGLSANYGAQISFNGLENNFWFATSLPDPMFRQFGTVFESYNHDIYGTVVSLSDGPSYSRRTLGINTATDGYPLFNQASWAITPAAVPVPGAVWLFGSALAGFGFLGKRRVA